MGSLNKLHAIEAFLLGGDPELCQKGGAVVRREEGAGDREAACVGHLSDIVPYLSRTWLDGEFDWGGTPSKV